MQRFDHRPARARHLRGFSLAECTVAVALVGLLIVAALESAGASKRREAFSADLLMGRRLASALRNEILLQAYEEPGSDRHSTFGLEPGESTGNRALFDDVDDYAGWAATPPTDRSGAPIAGFAGWTQQVDVSWADPKTLEPTAAINTGLKKITVTAAKNGRTVAALVSYRSMAWVDTTPSPKDATGNHAPVAVATSPDLTRRVDEMVSFDASASSDPDADSLSYVWSFGDGTSTAGKVVTHAYLAVGNYTCTLTVYDGRGGVGTAALTAVIHR